MNDVLEGLEAEALLLEEQHRWEHQALRIATLELDPEKAHYTHTLGRLTLQVAMLYPRFYEHLASDYGNATALRRRNIAAHPAYRAYVNGYMVALRSRDDALWLLEHQALPPGYELPAPTELKTDPFEGLV